MYSHARCSHCGNIWQARLLARAAPNMTWLYSFDHAPAYSQNTPTPSQWGAFHGAEVPFVFGDNYELKGWGERNLSSLMQVRTVRMLFVHAALMAPACF